MCRDMICRLLCHITSSQVTSHHHKSHHITSSHHHIITSSSHIITSSHHHIITYHHIITSSHHHIITSSHHHIITYHHITSSQVITSHITQHRTQHITNPSSRRQGRWVSLLHAQLAALQPHRPAAQHHSPHSTGHIRRRRSRQQHHPITVRQPQNPPVHRAPERHAHQTRRRRDEADQGKAAAEECHRESDDAWICVG